MAQASEEAESDIDIDSEPELDVISQAPLGTDCLLEPEPEIAEAIIVDTSEVETDPTPKPELKLQTKSSPPSVPQDFVAPCFSKEGSLNDLQNLMSNSTVNEILINNAQQVFIEQNGRIEQSALTFANNQTLVKVLNQLLEPSGRQLGKNSPIVDVRLDTGAQIHAIIPPLST